MSEKSMSTKSDANSQRTENTTLQTQVESVLSEIKSIDEKFSAQIEKLRSEFCEVHERSCQFLLEQLRQTFSADFKQVVELNKRIEKFSNLKNKFDSDIREVISVKNEILMRSLTRFNSMLSSSALFNYVNKRLNLNIKINSSDKIYFFGFLSLIVIMALYLFSQLFFSSNTVATIEAPNENEYADSSWKLHSLYPTLANFYYYSAEKPSHEKQSNNNHHNSNDEDASNCFLLVLNELKALINYLNENYFAFLD
jgi:hypothetical protein